LRGILKANHNQADGRVVIDASSRESPAIASILDIDYNMNENDVDVNDEREAYQWDGILVSENLTDEQAMLCPAVIGCFDLRSKHMYTVSVDNLQPVEWNKDAMDHLVLETKKKEMLKGLVNYHSDTNRRKDRDLIAGKGQSLVILLHGPPGVCTFLSSTA
jgi:hypothetical protein